MNNVGGLFRWAQPDGWRINSFMAGTDQQIRPLLVKLLVFDL